MSGASVVIYHPLGPQEQLFKLWREPRPQMRCKQPTVTPQLRKRYRSHLLAPTRSGMALPDQFDEDTRELVRDFRAFFPLFLSRNGAPGDRTQIPFSFPKHHIFDARPVELAGRPTIFISSRTLDMIELFARTMSLCARLNGAALPHLLQLQDPPPDVVTFAWLPLQFEGVPGVSFDDLLDWAAHSVAPGRLQAKLSGWFNAMPSDLRKGPGRWQLTHFLAQVMLLTMKRLARGAGQEEAMLEMTRELPRHDGAATLDARYLATVVLTFVALHEHAHITHGHQSVEPMEQDARLSRIAEGVMQFAKENPDTVAKAVDFRGQTQFYEQDADCFAIEATSEQYRDEMLEAATLWFTALAAADQGGVSWVTKATESEGRRYPQYAMRVWFLNGRYSTGLRQGDVAQTTYQIANAIEQYKSSLELPVEQLLALSHALWDFALQEELLARTGS